MIGFRGSLDGKPKRTDCFDDKEAGKISSQQQVQEGCIDTQSSLSSLRRLEFVLD